MIRSIVGLAFVALTSAALAADPRPPHIAVGFTAEPAPIVQGGATKLFYEMMLTNVSPSRYILESIEVRGGKAATIYEGVALESVVAPFGTRPDKPDPASLVIDGGRGAIVYLELHLGHTKAPFSITHELRIKDEKGESHVVTIAPQSVSAAAPMVVAPPLRGDWIAGDAVNNGIHAAHRRTALVESGRVWLAQRYRSTGCRRRRWTGSTPRSKGPKTTTKAISVTVSPSSAHL